MPLLKKILLPIGALIILGLVIFYLTPPKSIYEANFFQIGVLLGPLFLFIYSTVQLGVHFWKRSLVISIGFMLLIILQLLDFLNVATVVIVIALTFFLFRYLKKPDLFQIPRRIPKLSRLEKQR